MNEISMHFRDHPVTITQRMEVLLYSKQTNQYDIFMYTSLRHFPGGGFTLEIQPVGRMNIFNPTCHPPKKNILFFLLSTEFCKVSVKSHVFFSL